MSTASAQVSPTDGQRMNVSQEQRTSEAKAAFVASLTSVGSNLDTDLQIRAKDIHANSKALEKQEKELQKETKKLSKQSDAMQKVVDKTKNDLKDFEDLPGRMSDLDRDLAMLEEMLRLAEDGDYDDWEGEDEHEHEEHQDVVPQQEASQAGKQRSGSHHSAIGSSGAEPPAA